MDLKLEEAIKEMNEIDDMMINNDKLNNDNLVERRKKTSYVFWRNIQHKEKLQTNVKIEMAKRIGSKHKMKVRKRQKNEVKLCI